MSAQTGRKEVAQKFLNLSADQIMVLTDRIQNTDVGTEDMPVIAYTLLLKLGSAYCEMLGDGKKPGEIPIAVSEAETWLLRSKITSGDKTSTDPLFGVRTLNQIYKLLSDYNLGDLPDESEEHGEQFTDDKKVKLKEFLNAGDSNTDNTNDNTNDNTQG